MRFSQAILLAGLGALGLSPFALVTGASAQIVSTPAVTVNPIAGGNGGVLLYPGGQYMRVVHPLLQPGEKSKDLGAIRLHMPSKRRPATTTVARAEESAPVEIAPVQRAPVAPRPIRSKRVAAAAPPPAPNTENAYTPGFGSGAAGAAGLGSFATGDAAPPPPPPPPAPVRAAAAPKPAPAPKPAAAPPVKVARAEPAKSAQAEQPEPEAVAPGLNKRSVILFAPEATDPAESALGAIKYLASDLASAMTGPGSRIQLQAFGGPRGDKSSEARRLSLKRALAIRQVLIDDGVPADRIDVHAGGGVDDSGPADRVDVYIKA